MKKLKPSVTEVAWKKHGNRSKWLLQGFAEKGKPIRLFFRTRVLAEAELVRRRLSGKQAGG